MILKVDAVVEAFSLQTVENLTSPAPQLNNIFLIRSYLVGKSRHNKHSS